MQLKDTPKVEQSGSIQNNSKRTLEAGKFKPSFFELQGTMGVISCTKPFDIGEKAPVQNVWLRRSENYPHDFAPGKQIDCSGAEISPDDQEGMHMWNVTGLGLDSNEPSPDSTYLYLHDYTDTTKRFGEFVSSDPDYVFMPIAGKPTASITINGKDASTKPGVYVPAGEKAHVKMQYTLSYNSPWILRGGLGKTPEGHYSPRFTLKGFGDNSPLTCSIKSNYSPIRRGIPLNELPDTSYEIRLLYPKDYTPARITCEGDMEVPKEGLELSTGQRFYLSPNSKYTIGDPVDASAVAYVTTEKEPEDTPDTTTPETPGTTEPETPETTEPETPETTTTKSEKTTTPKSETPDTTKPETPDTTEPETTTPKSETPDTTTPESTTPKTETPVTDSSEVTTPDTQEVTTPTFSPVTSRPAPVVSPQPVRGKYVEPQNEAPAPKSAPQEGVAVNTGGRVEKVSTLTSVFYRLASVFS